MVRIGRCSAIDSQAIEPQNLASPGPGCRRAGTETAGVPCTPAANLAMPVLRRVLTMAIATAMALFNLPGLGFPRRWWDLHRPNGSRRAAPPTKRWPFTAAEQAAETEQRIGEGRAQIGEPGASAHLRGIVATARCSRTHRVRTSTSWSTPRTRWKLHGARSCSTANQRQLLGEEAAAIAPSACNRTTCEHNRPGKLREGPARAKPPRFRGQSSKPTGGMRSGALDREVAAAVAAVNAVREGSGGAGTAPGCTDREQRRRRPVPAPRSAASPAWSPCTAYTNDYGGAAIPVSTCASTGIPRSP
jgi:hypothetical protein